MSLRTLLKDENEPQPIGRKFPVATDTPRVEEVPEPMLDELPVEPVPANDAPLTSSDVVAVMNDEDGLSPEMAACQPRERAFVLAVMTGEKWASAARLAGYGNSGSSPGTFAVIGNRIRSYPRVKDALVAEAKSALRSLAPKAVSTVKDVLDGFDPKARLKAASMVLDRTDTIINKVEATVTVRDPMQQAVDYLAHLIQQGATERMLLNEFGPGGLARYRTMLEAREKAKVIDAEFKVLENKTGENNE